MHPSQALCEFEEMVRHEGLLQTLNKILLVEIPIVELVEKNRNGLQRKDKRTLRVCEPVLLDSDS